MKRFFKILGYALGVLILLVLVFVTYIQLKGIPRYQPVQVELKVDITSERVENEMRIATIQCIQCHAENIIQSFEC